MKQNFKPLILKTALGILLLDYEEIIHIEADRNVCNLSYIETNKSVRLLISMNRLIRLLPEELFLKCHRSHIVNVQHINSILIKTQEIVLCNGEIVPISLDCLRSIRNQFCL